MGLNASEWIEIAAASASGLVAIATGFLAWKTRALAGETTRMAVAAEAEAEAVAEQVKASERQIELTRASIQASIQPWLTRDAGGRVVIAPRGNDGMDIFTKLRNVGKGVALLASGEDCIVEGREPTDRRYGFPSAAALPPEESTELGFRVEHVDVRRFLRQDEGHGWFAFSVLYTDSTAQQPVIARFRVTATSSAATEWLVFEIEYTRKERACPLRRSGSTPPSSRSRSLLVSGPQRQGCPAWVTSRSRPANPSRPSNPSIRGGRVTARPRMPRGGWRLVLPLPAANTG